jgi:hypothetical protein
MDPMPLQQLRDIHDISSVPWWPLAPGWWLLAIVMLLLAFAVWRWRAVLSLRVPMPGITFGTWRWGAAVALRDLGRRARAGQDAKTTAGELSALLRRIAMARLGRSACAGLAGSDWLDWLETHDPNGFHWRERGRVLLDAPYAPASRVGEGDLLALIEAVAGWVTTREPASRTKWSRFFTTSAQTRASSGV